MGSARSPHTANLLEPLIKILTLTTVNSEWFRQTGTIPLEAFVMTHNELVNGLVGYTNPLTRSYGAGGWIGKHFSFHRSLTWFKTTNLSHKFYSEFSFLFLPEQCVQIDSDFPPNSAKLFRVLTPSKENCRRFPWHRPSDVLSKQNSQDHLATSHEMLGVSSTTKTSSAWAWFHGQVHLVVDTGQLFRRPEATYLRRKCSRLATKKSFGS